MKYTTNYGFKKPEPLDTRNIKDLNESFDLIDTQLKTTQNKNENLQATFEQLTINAGSSNAEVVAARRDNVRAVTYSSLPNRLDSIGTRIEQLDSTKANKADVTNVLTPKGKSAYASLPMTGNTVGWYYYCPDGNAVDGPGNYVWNGTSWYFGGTSDQGYNVLSDELHNIETDKLSYQAIENGYSLSLNKKGLWEIGAYDPTTGEKNSANQRLKTINYLNGNEYVTQLATDHYVTLMCWDENDTYIGIWQPSTNNILKITNHYHSVNVKVVKRLFPSYKFKLIIRNSDSTKLNDDAWSKIGLFINEIQWATQMNMNSQQISTLENKSAVLGNEIKSKTRVFKPKYYHSIQVTYYYEDKINLLKQMIDNWCRLGVDGFIITVDLVFTNGALTMRESDTLVLDIRDYIVSKGKTVFAIKIHCTTYDESENFRNLYQTEVQRIASTFRSNVYSFILFNECKLLYNRNVTSWIVDTINLVKSSGLRKVSISYDLLMFGIGRIPDSIVSILDYLSFNYYPPVGNKGRATTYDDCLTAWQSSWILPSIETYKDSYPKKEIYITEVGIEDYFVSYGNPSKYTLDKVDTDKAYGETTRNYLQACMDTLNNKISGITSWFEIYLENSIDMFIKYLGGE